MRIIIRLLGFVKKYWIRAVIAYICLLASTAFSIAVPRLIGAAIDTGVMGGEFSFLLFAGLAIIAVSIFRGGVSYGQNYFGQVMSQSVAYDIRNAIYEHLQRLSFAFHDKTQTGQLMSRATADVEGVRRFISFALLRSSQMVILFLGISFLVVSMNWRLALVSFICLPFVAYRGILVGRRLRPIWMSIQQGIAAMVVVLQENLSGVRVVKAFSRQRTESSKFKEKAQDLYDRNLAAHRQQAFNTPLMSFLLTLTTGLVLWYGGREVISGRLTPGELAQFILYLGMLGMPVRMVGGMINMWSRAVSSGQRIFEILDAESEVKDAPNALALPPVNGFVRFEGVSFSYDSVSSVLRNVNLEARPGEVIALLGATGSGKSTVVNLIPRFYDVTTGRITIDGVDIRDVTLASLRRSVGIVQQDVFLFSATIRDNIAYGAVDASIEEIIAVAKTARLHDFVSSLPQGYDTWVGERGITLSGGEKQRVAIARTLLMNQRVLILDDSTSSVDTETEYLIQQAMSEVVKGRTTFVIAHRLPSVKKADQILVIKDGEIVERGNHTELLEKGGIYKQIYDLQLRDQEEALEVGRAGKAASRED